MERVDFSISASTPTPTATATTNAEFIVDAYGYWGSWYLSDYLSFAL